MQPALLIRLRPRGPWRYGAPDGSLDRADLLYRSDRLYSAVTLAMQRLGYLEDWLVLTTRNTVPGVVFGSLFPFQGDALYAIPPTTVWPPPAAQVTAPNPVFLAKIRWRAVSFIPLSVIDTLLSGGNILAEQWLPDPESECLLRRDRPNAPPLRHVMRRTAPVDRVSHQTSAVTSVAGVEFEPGAGLWTVARFRDEQIENVWRSRIEGAFRLLADSGFGGRRSIGWGQSEEPVFETGRWPALLFPKLARRTNGTAQTGPLFWLLSLYVPGEQDSIDWAGGDYQLVTRGGRGKQGAETKQLRMIAEGSVVAASSEPSGKAVDVAPEDFAHPVFRAGFALSLELPERGVEEKPAEETQVAEACQPQIDETNRSSPAEAQTRETNPGETSAEPDAAPEPEHERGVVAEAEPEIKETEAEIPVIDSAESPEFEISETNPDQPGRAAESEDPDAL